MAYLHLVKDKNIHFRIRKNGEQSDVRQAVIELQINSESVTPSYNAAEDGQAGTRSLASSSSASPSSSADLCSKLKNRLFFREDGRIVERYLSLSFQNIRKSAELHGQEENAKFRLRLQGGLLEEIQNILGEDTRVSVEIDNFHHTESLYSSSPPHPNQRDTESHHHHQRPSSSNWSITLSNNGWEKATTKGMEITLSPVAPYCEDLIDFPESWVKSWCTFLDWMYWEYSATISVLIHSNGLAINGGSQDDSDLSLAAVEMQALNKKILLEQYSTDMELVAESGAAVKCHSIFLIAQSEIMKSMVETQNIKRIWMDGVSEEGVTAFLTFLYCREKNAAEQSTRIAMELLRAAYRYAISPLELAMQSILLKKPDTSYSIQDAMNLFSFCAKIKKFKSLKMKGVQVLKGKFHELPMSTFLSQFRGNLDGAKELFEAFLEFKQ